MTKASPPTVGLLGGRDLARNLANMTRRVFACDAGATVRAGDDPVLTSIVNTDDAPEIDWQENTGGFPMVERRVGDASGDLVRLPTGFTVAEG